MSWVDEAVGLFLDGRLPGLTASEVRDLIDRVGRDTRLLKKLQGFDPETQRIELLRVADTRPRDGARSKPREGEHR